MSAIVDELHITQEVYASELIPALRDWQDLLQDKGVKPHLWFLFGSVVRQTEAPQHSNDPVQILAREFGIRGPGSRTFRSESDIDLGLVVDDGDDEIELHMYDPSSPFRTTRVGGHVLSLTRFTTAWMNRKNTDVEKLRNGTTRVLGIYGRVIPVELIPSVDPDAVAC